MLDLWHVYCSVQSHTYHKPCPKQQQATVLGKKYSDKTHSNTNLQVEKSEALAAKKPDNSGVVNVLDLGLITTFLSSRERDKKEIRKLVMRTGRRITFTGSFICAYLTRMKWENSSLLPMLTAFPILACMKDVQEFKNSNFSTRIKCSPCRVLICYALVDYSERIQRASCFASHELLEGLCYQTWVLHGCRCLVHG